LRLKTASRNEPQKIAVAIYLTVCVRAGTFVRVHFKRERRKVLKLVPHNHPQLKWRLAGYYVNGKRVRKFFTSKADGHDFIDHTKIKTQNLGTRALNVPGWLHEMAVEGQARLTPHRKTLRDAVDDYLSKLEASARSCTVKQLCQMLIETRIADGISYHYEKDLKSRLGRFAGDLGHQTVSNVTVADIDEWLRSLQSKAKLSAESRNNFRRVLRTLFSFAAARGYCRENPVVKTAKAKPVSKPPEILTVKELKSLLKCAPRRLIPSIAIGAFAGLRPAEIQRLDWQDIRLDRGFIEVAASKSKTARRRLVTILPNLKEWLKPHVRPKGPVDPPNRRNLREAAQRKAAIRRWPKNGFRHSFASYHLAKFQDAAALALQMGHTTTGMLFAHYREVVTPDAAESYWRIGLIKGEIVES
jgi:integrase